MDRINFSTRTNDFNSIESLEPANKTSVQSLEKKDDLPSSAYNPNGLEAKSNENSFSNSFLKTSLLNKTSFQPSDTKARSKVSDETSTTKSSAKGQETQTITKPSYDVNKIPGVSKNVTPEFLSKVESVAKELEAEPATLLAIMSFETGGEFSSSTTNSSTNATGLIQFIPSTARSLLTKKLKDPTVNLDDKKQIINSLPVDKQSKEELTKLVADSVELPQKKKQIETEISNLTNISKDLTKQLREAKNKKLPKEQQNELSNQLKDVLSQKSKLITEKKQVTGQINSTSQSIDNKISKGDAIKAFREMSPTKQLDYVKEYLLPYKGKLNSPQDAYLSVLFPQAVGKGSQPNASVFSQGSDYYQKNQGLDGIVDGKKDGVVTVKEATKKVTDFLRNAER
ncbi:MAG: hypothetical protein WAQ98_02355 [Blastocatellia bacterium]